MSWHPQLAPPTLSKIKKKWTFSCTKWSKLIFLRVLPPFPVRKSWPRHWLDTLTWTIFISRKIAIIIIIKNKTYSLSYTNCQYHKPIITEIHIGLHATKGFVCFSSVFFFLVPLQGQSGMIKMFFLRMGNSIKGMNFSDLALRSSHLDGHKKLHVYSFFIPTVCLLLPM